MPLVVVIEALEDVAVAVGVRALAFLQSVHPFTHIPFTGENASYSVRHEKCPTIGLEERQSGTGRRLDKGRVKVSEENRKKHIFFCHTTYAISDTLSEAIDAKRSTYPNLDFEGCATYIGLRTYTPPSPLYLYTPLPCLTPFLHPPL